MTHISRARFAEMVKEATVDCYNDSEKITGWFTILDDHLVVPFEVTVLGIPIAVERVDLTKNDQIFAICVRGPHKQSIPLVDSRVPRRFRADGSGLRRTSYGSCRPARRSLAMIDGFATVSSWF